jgi:hypothetical protein
MTIPESDKIKGNGTRIKSDLNGFARIKHEQIDFNVLKSAYIRVIRVLLQSRSLRLLAGKDCPGRYPVHPAYSCEFN